jgi:opacity protein-like surface antigen
MKHIAQTLTLGLVVLAASTTSPRAADWVGSGGVIKDFANVKDYRNAAVPVPAPTPAPLERAEWYMRADIGWNFAAHGGVDYETTLRAGDASDTADVVFGGVGFGRYISPGWRADFTIDAKPKRNVVPKNQQYTFTKTTVLDATTVPQRTQTDTYLADHGEQASITNYSGMFNIYRDFDKTNGLQPYVGFGLGGGIARLQRNFQETSTCTQSVDSSTPGVINPCTTVGPTAGGGKGTTSWGLAAALMAGFTMDVMPGVKLDSNYRFMYESTAASVSGTSAEGKSINLKVGDRFDHELRTGLRIDIN